MGQISRKEFLSRTFKIGAFAVVAGTAALASCDKFGDNTYSVNASKCTACKDCLSSCNFGAISIGSVATISSSKCVGCGKCVGRCPEGAIS